MKNNGINLYIDRNANVYPSCKTYADDVIATLNDNAYEKVIELFGDTTFNSITIELSGICNARCVYCFQRGDEQKKYEYYDFLKKFLTSVKTERLFCSGGELTCQPDALEFLLKLKSEMPNVIFHLKTNGHADLQKAKVVQKIFNSAVISFNGFSSHTTKLIMGENIDVQKTKRFAKTLALSGVNTGFKYLLSPMSLADVVPFLEWAIKVKPKSIIFQTAYNYRILAGGKVERADVTFGESDYYNAVVKRVKNKIFSVIFNNEINRDYNRLVCDDETAQLFKLTYDEQKLFRHDGNYDLED